MYKCKEGRASTRLKKILILYDLVLINQDDIQTIIRRVYFAKEVISVFVLTFEEKKCQSFYLFCSCLQLALKKPPIWNIPTYKVTFDVSDTLRIIACRHQVFMYNLKYF